MVLLSGLSTILMYLGVFYASFGSAILTRTVSEQELLWSIRIPIQQEIKRWRFKASLGWILMIVGGIIIVWNFCDCMWAWEFPWHIWLPQMASIIFIYPCWKQGKKWVDQTLENGDTALVLDSLSILQDVDANIHNAQKIRIMTDRIDLLSQTGYPFFSAIYSRYGLGNLEKESQKILLSYYFRQKYKDTFACELNTQGEYVETSSNPNQIAGVSVRDVCFVRK